MTEATQSTDGNKSAVQPLVRLRYRAVLTEGASKKLVTESVAIRWVELNRKKSPGFKFWYVAETTA